MAITPALLNEIRLKTAGGPFAFLIDFIDETKSAYRRLTNSFEDIVSGSNTYKSYPFLVTLPRNTAAFGQQIQLVFANFPDQAGLATLKSDLDKVQRADFQFINKARPADSIFPKASYFFSAKDSLRIDSNQIFLGLSRRVLEDKPYPFRRFNSLDHPMLFHSWKENAYV